MFVEGFELPGDSFEAVMVGTDGTRTALSVIAGGRFLVSGYEFNSLVAGCGTMLDLIANTSGAAKNSGVDYVTDTYYGPDAAYNGKTVGVIGAFKEPPASDADKSTWWRAMAELIIRLGKSKVEEATADTAAPGARRMVEMIGVCGAAAYPQRLITPRTTLRIDPDVARNFIPVYQGAQSFAVRLVSALQGQNVAVTAAETNAMPLAQQIAQIYTDEAKKRARIGIGAVASVPVVGGLARVAWGGRR